jgi:hypothetical protein
MTMSAQPLIAIGFAIIFALYVYMLFPLPNRPFPRHVWKAAGMAWVIAVSLVVLDVLTQPPGTRPANGLAMFGSMLIVVAGFFGSISAFLFWKKRHLTRTEQVVLVLAWSALAVFVRSRLGA